MVANKRRDDTRGDLLCSEVSPEAIDLLSALIKESEFTIPGQAAYRYDVLRLPGLASFSSLDCFWVPRRWSGWKIL